MSEQQIQPGARVRVTYEGEYVQGPYGHRRINVQTEDGFSGGESPIPVFADVEVIAPPLPPQPSVGEYVEVRGPLFGTIEVWERRDDVIVGEMLTGWYCLSDSDQDVLDWAELHQRGEVTVLRRAGESGYVPAIHQHRVLWLHDCGHAKRYPVVGCHPDHDPNQGNDGTSWPCGLDCPSPGADWTPLYVQAGQSDG